MHIRLAVLWLLCTVSSLSAFQSPDGRWNGKLHVSAFELQVTLDFASLEDGVVGTIDIPQQNSFGLELANISWESPQLTFDLESELGKLHFEGEIEGNRYSGTFKQGLVVGRFITDRVGNSRHLMPSQTRIEGPGRLDGFWSGVLSLGTLEVRLQTRFRSSGSALNGTLDIREQGARNLALSDIRLEGSDLHFELAVATGDMVFDGKLDGDEIKGEVMQSGVRGAFRLSRGLDEADTEDTAQEVLPYREEEVTFRNGEILLAGTLTLPETEGPHPAMVLISGNGPQNRDEEVLDFKPFKVIADHLTRKGIAVLRYDDRGVGGSSGNTLDATSEDFASDVLAALSLLQNRKDIAGDKLGLLGHGEGALVAPMTALKSKDVSFLVLLAPPGVRGERILQAQAEIIARDAGATDEEIAANAAIQDRLFATVRNTDGWEPLKADVRSQGLEELERMPPERRQLISDEEAFLDSYVSAKLQLRLAQSRWFAFYLDYDPAQALEQLECPILALFGGVDMQMPTSLNRPALERALKRGGKADYSIETIPNANHLFLYSTTGSPGEYPYLMKEFVPGLLDRMSSWIVEKTNVTPE